MDKNLTNSHLDRQNILNNHIALEEIRKAVDVKCIVWENKLYLTKAMVAEFFSIEMRTLQRYISSYEAELKDNGYIILTGRKLQDFIKVYDETFATDINVSRKIRTLGIFDFRAFLNIAMLLVESDTAADLRRIMLDVVIDTINQKVGGSTKYINQRDKDFIGAFLQEENYRCEFTEALRNYVDMGKGKYPIYTDKIYQSIFKEKAKEYREILKLSQKDRLRDTLYSEVLTIIASYECGLAAEIKAESERLGRKLDNWELSRLFSTFENMALWKPLINNARTKMASRDMALRDAFHYQLQEYIKPLEKREYDKFLGSAGDELEKLMAENADVLQRLKENGE